MTKLVLGETCRLAPGSTPEEPQLVVRRDRPRHVSARSLNLMIVAFEGSNEPRFVSALSELRDSRALLRRCEKVLAEFPGHGDEAAWNEWCFRRDALLADLAQAGT